MPKESLSTLLLLLDLALQAAPKLEQLARDAINGKPGAEVVQGDKPTKGVARALQKVQEEYDGDYTRLLDYARITIVCEDMPTLENTLGWLLSAERFPRFEALRTKDRLSRDWDAEMSGRLLPAPERIAAAPPDVCVRLAAGGNRDVMLNGWLALGGRRRFIVEVQLHLRVLYELKSDLHVLYAGARVLGAMEDSTMKHEGMLTGEVLERMERRVVRKFSGKYSEFAPEQKDHLIEVLCSEPCALLELDLAGCHCGSGGEPLFEGLTMAQVLVPSAGAIACTRLRDLCLELVGLVGEIPPELARCSALTDLRLARNSLTGPIPDWLPELPSLKHISLHMNQLTGPIPESVCRCQRLEAFIVYDNNLSGFIPAAFAEMPSLCHPRFGGSDAEWRVYFLKPHLKEYLRAHGILYADAEDKATGNKDLKITTALRDAIWKMAIERTLGKGRKELLGATKLEEYLDPHHDAYMYRSMLFPKVVG